MPRNRISKKSADGRYTYSVTDRAGVTHRLRSRTGEKKPDFAERCEKLDLQCQFEVRADSFDELFRTWRDMHLKPNCSNADQRVTLDYYERFVRPKIGHLKLSELTAPIIYGLLTDAARQGWSRSTISKVKGIVSRPFNWAVHALGLNLPSPTASVRFQMRTAQQPKRRRYLTDAEVERFLAAASASKYFDCFRLMILLGLRPSEALGLQARDISRDHLTIRRGVTAEDVSEGKTLNAQRDVPLPDEVKQMLAELKSRMAFATPEGWLFPTETGQPDMSALTSAFKRAIRQTGQHKTGSRQKKLELIQPPITASLYDLRHTFATRMAERGMPAVTLKKIMGHSDIKTTLTYYVDVTDSMLDDAVALMSAQHATSENGPKYGPENEKSAIPENNKTPETLQSQGF